MTSRRQARRISALVIAALAAAATGVASADAATYAPRVAGTAVGDPASGSTTVAFNLKTSAACPTGTGVVQAFIDNAAAGWVGVIAIGTNDTDVANVNTTGVPMSDTLQGIASTNGKTLVNGTYDISLVCLPDAFSSPTVQFDGHFTVTGTTYTFTVPGVTSTTTTIAATPPSSVQEGGTVTLTATVTPASATGTVQFTDSTAGSTTPLGAAVPVSGGTASIVTTSLAPGSHTLRAAFTTATTSFSNSQSGPLAYTVVGAGQTLTTTSLVVNPPGSAVRGAPVTLVALVNPATAGGVTFTDGGGALDGPVRLAANGTASLTLPSADVGTHSFAASFAPDDPAYLGSQSAVVTYRVTLPEPEQIGTLNVRGGANFQTIGTATDDIHLVTVTDEGRSPGCPAPSTYTSATVTGPGAWAIGILAAIPSNTQIAIDAEFQVDLSYTFATLAAANALTIEPGEYRISVYCEDDLGLNRFGRFVGSLWFYDSTHWLNADPAVVGIPTVTTMTVSPAGRGDAGAAITLSATVEPPGATGKVQFQTTSSGTVTPIGDPVTVRNGRASLTTKTLAKSLYYFTATLTPSGGTTKYAASTSGQVVYAIAPPLPPIPPRSAIMTGPAKVGGALTCSGTFKNATSIRFTWIRDRTVIAGATGQRYRVTRADRAHWIRCRIYASNAGGTTSRFSPAARIAS